MKLAMIGLGRMGGNMVKRLMQGGQKSSLMMLTRHRAKHWQLNLPMSRQQAI